MDVISHTYIHCCIRSTSCIRKNGGWNISQIFDKAKKKTNETSSWQIWNRNPLYQIIETNCFKTRMVFEFLIICEGNQKPEFETPLTTSTITFAHKNNESPLFDVYTQFRGIWSWFYQLLNEQDVSFTFIYSFAFYLLCKWCCNLNVRRLNSIIVLKWLKLKMLTGS